MDPMELTRMRSWWLSESWWLLPWLLLLSSMPVHEEVSFKPLSSHDSVSVTCRPQPPHSCRLCYPVAPLLSLLALLSPVVLLPWLGSWLHTACLLWVSLSAVPGQPAVPLCPVCCAQPACCVCCGLLCLLSAVPTARCVRCVHRSAVPAVPAVPTVCCVHSLSGLLCPCVCCARGCVCSLIALLRGHASARRARVRVRLLGPIALEDSLRRLGSG
jgi:hypothetical protein